MPTNEIKDSSTNLLHCSVSIFFQLRLMANCQYNFQRHILFPSPNCKFGAGLFISITIRASLIALNKFKKKIIIFLNRGLPKAQGQLQNRKFFISLLMLFKNSTLSKCCLAEIYSDFWVMSLVFSNIACYTAHTSFNWSTRTYSNVVNYGSKN